MAEVVELTVTAPPAFAPDPAGTAAPPTAPPPPVEDALPGTAWSRWMTDQQGARLIAYTRHAAAAALKDPTLEPDKLTLDLLGPPLAACARALPVGEMTGDLAGKGTAAKWAVAGLVVILALAIGIPILLALRRRQRERREERPREEREAVQQDEGPSASSDPWRGGRARTVGSGILEE